MISSRSESEAELLAEGWQRCFVADEPRLSEAVETYRDLGYEVKLMPFTPEESACSECVAQEPDRCRVIYIRKQGPS
jgi:hypothetical protein